MSRVFLIEPVTKDRLDLSKAKIYGDIVYAFPVGTRRPSIFRHIDFGRALIDAMQRISFDANADYICCTGSLSALAISLTVIAMHWPKLQLLIFDSINSEYVSRTFYQSQF